jgi:hypothetical protein
MHHDDVPSSQVDTSHSPHPKPWQSRNDTSVISRVNRSTEGSAEECISNYLNFTGTVHVIIRRDFPSGSSMLQDISIMPKLHLFFELSNQEILQSRVNHL